MKKYVFQILKKGRKWFEGVNQKGYKAKIEINEISNGWQEGQTVEFWGREEVEKSRFGTSIKIYPIPEEEATRVAEEEKIKKAKSEYERWKGYIENNVIEGRLYEKGIEKIKELAQLLGNEQETEEYIKEVKERVTRIKMQRKYNTIMSYLEKPLSLQNFYKNYSELRHEFLKEKFEQDKERIEMLKNKAIENEALKKIGIYKTFERRNTEIEDEIRKLAGNNEKIIQLLEEEIKRKEEAIDQLLEKYEKAVSSLSHTLTKDEILRLIKYEKLVNEPYIEVNIKEDIKKCFLIVDILNDLTNLISVRREESFINFIPQSKCELYDRIKGIMADIEKLCYEYLSTCEGKPVNIEEVLPKHWNHIKNEYIAEVLPSMERVFISRRVNFTWSRANASLEYDLPDEIGSIIVAKSGSYKHMYHVFYRLTSSGWEKIYSVETPDWGEVLKNLAKWVVMSYIRT